MEKEKGHSITEPRTLKEFRNRFPQIWENYQRLRDSCDETRPLEEKTRELIRVAISVALRRRGGLIAHLDRARALGATEDEMHQAILLNLPLLGFPDTLAAFRTAREHLGG